MAQWEDETMDKQGSFSHGDGRYTLFLLQRLPHGDWHLWVSEPGEKTFTRNGSRRWLVNILRVIRAEILGG
jgi:hypothetical protein